MGDSISSSEFKAAIDKLLAEITAIKDEVSVVKGDQSKLTVAVNWLQSNKYAEDESSSSDRKNRDQ